MKYFIERPNTWRAQNRKCEEIITYVDRFRNCLIEDEKAKYDMIDEIRHKVDLLNTEYPKTKKLVVRFEFDDFLSCRPEEQKSDSDYVFTMILHPVKTIYESINGVGILALAMEGE